MTEQKITQELPDACDTCGASRAGMTAIEQSMTRAIGKITRVVGYHCAGCNNSHLYRMDPPKQPATRELGPDLYGSPHLQHLKPAPGTE